VDDGRALRKLDREAARRADDRRAEPLRKDKERADGQGEDDPACN
jgi:hypothetical protein